MARLRALLVLALLSSGCADVPNTADAADASVDPASPVEGAWRRIDVRSGAEVLINQPGLMLYVDGHYSVTSVNGTTPRLPVDSTSTAADLRAVWGTGFSANAGTYEIEGETLTTRPFVAKNPNTMAPDYFERYTFRVVDDTLTMSRTANAAGPIADPLTGKYVRVR
jgi:hypothetical protein